MSEGIRAAAGTPALAGDGRTVHVRALTYGPVDTYRTSWKRGVFLDSLRSRNVPVVMNHDDGRVVGRVTDFTDGPDGLDLVIRLADLDAVPEARAAQALLRDKCIDGVSVKYRDAVTAPDPHHRGALQFQRAHLSHVSFVVDASVPGARVLAVRAAGATRPVTRAEVERMKLVLDRRLTESRLRRAQDILDRRAVQSIQLRASSPRAVTPRPVLSVPSDKPPVMPPGPWSPPALPPPALPQDLIDARVAREHITPEQVVAEWEARQR